MKEKEQIILKMLEADMLILKDALKETVNDIVNQGFSKYPILVAHIEEISIADKIIDRSLFNTAFHFSASTLESLVEKGIILKDREEAMAKKIEESKNKVCVLMLHPDLMNFIFSPLK